MPYHWGTGWERAEALLTYWPHFLWIYGQEWASRTSGSSILNFTESSHGCLWELCRGNQCLSCTQLRSQSSLSCLLVSWPFGRLWPWCFLLWLDARQQPGTLWAECQDKVWADFPEISLVLEIASWARWLFRTKVQFPPLFSTLAISEGASSTYPGGDRLEEGQRRQHSCCWRGWEVTD